MRIPSTVLPLLALAAAIPTLSVQAQEARSAKASVASVRDDRFKWFFGVQGGALFFTTQKQTQSGIPAAGAHLSVVSRRGGVQLGVEEGFGSDEPTAFLDPQSGNQQRLVTFDRIRRYGFNMTGYPVRGALEPYLGVGFGMLQVLNPQVGGSFTSSQQAAQSELEAQDRSASAFVSLLGGVQFRVGRLAAFGQYQINTAPAAGSLLRGTGHSLMGGLRFSLGSAKEDIKGGGY
jgi:hypothetical protein